MAGHWQQAGVKEQAGDDVKPWLENMSSPSIDKVLQGCRQLAERLEQIDSANIDLDVVDTLYSLVDASEQKADCIVMSGVWVYILRCLQSPNLDLISRSVEILAYLSIRAPKRADILIDGKILPAVCALGHRNLSKRTLKPVSWLLKNLFVNCTNAPMQEELMLCLPMLVEFLSYSEKHVVDAACHALSWIVDRISDGGVCELIDLGIREPVENILKDHTFEPYDCFRKARHIASIVDLHEPTDPKRNHEV